MKKAIFILIFSLVSYQNIFAQLADSCKLKIGTNLGGLADYGTELPFVDLMHSCRVWYTKNVGDPSGPFNSETVNLLSFRPDGYPTHLPQTIAASPFPQTVATIWAVTDGWQAGSYTILYDGLGTLELWGGASNIVQVTPNKITFDMLMPVGSVLEMKLLTSAASDPLRNIRVLMPGSELTYLTQPFNPIWLSKALIFSSFRFMDWGATNNWGQSSPYDWEYTTLFDWSERQQMNHYTWANSKGIPYEMMVKLMNDYDVDGWVCVPHRASNDYITQMATFFKNNVEPKRHLTVEYSNEIWNWMFGQTNWAFNYGCTLPGVSWPEGIVPYVQNCLDIWTDVYADNLCKITRIVGVQTGWQDVSNRIVYNLTPNSFDAFSPTYYFGLSEAADSTLDALGASATVADIAFHARASRVDEMSWILGQKAEIGDSLDIPMIFYEGGQHLTPTPFGDLPTYAVALEDAMRDTSMYNLYMEWYDFLKTLQTGTKPLQLMNFSFISSRSAQYGSWGILETMDQDLAVVPAPKYQATMDIMSNCVCTIPASIAGSTVVCNNQTSTYSAGAQPLCTSFEWIITNGTIVSGCGSTDSTCTVLWNTPGSGNIALEILVP
jgi:hypothetical protein